jgi:hypothetical protein
LAQHHAVLRKSTNVRKYISIIFRVDEETNKQKARKLVIIKVGNEGDIFLRNVGRLATNHTVLYPGSWKSSKP